MAVYTAIRPGKEKNLFAMTVEADCTNGKVDYEVLGVTWVFGLLAGLFAISFWLWTWIAMVIVESLILTTASIISIGYLLNVRNVTVVSLSPNFTKGKELTRDYRFAQCLNKLANCKETLKSLQDIRSDLNDESFLWPHVDMSVKMISALRWRICICAKASFHAPIEVVADLEEQASQAEQLTETLTSYIMGGMQLREHTETVRREIECMIAAIKELPA